jgi:hypothetical protein
VSKEANYLHDVILLLLERGREAADEARSAREKGQEGAEFSQGRALGYYEVLSTMVNQLEVFDIRKEPLGIPQDLDLESELF